MQVVFPKIGHFWQDSGLVGLVKILEEQEHDVTINTDSQQLILSGSGQAIQSLLEKAYDAVVERYYNVSTRKQREETPYQFYYDSRLDRFISFPKKKSCGIAEIIYNKAARPTGSSVKWVYKSDRKVELEYKGKKIRRTVAHLPPSHAHLQERMDEFLNEHGLDITTAGLLLDGPNAVRPNVKIKAAAPLKKAKGNCFLCGQPSDTFEEATQTTFPLITGTSGVLSFNPMARNPEKVCWKCAFLGKFVPANGFFYTAGKDIFAFFPYSASLNKMLDAFAPLHEAEYQDPNYLCNFDNKIKGFFYHVFEITFAFLYTLYDKLFLRQSGGEEKSGLLNYNELFGLLEDRAPLEFYVLHARKRSDTFAVKTLWPFRETGYFYRLMFRVEGHETPAKTGDNREAAGARDGETQIRGGEQKIRGNRGVQIAEVMRLLVDYRQENEKRTLMRNRICERILKKQSILDLLEKHVYSVETSYIKPLVDFLLIYEPEVRKGDSMTREEQDAAVTLGRRIGTAVAKSEQGKKGDLFALRKTRKLVDFLEQINRLQFKLGGDLIIPPDLYEGKLTQDNFQEFKQFCLIAALNSYYAAENESRK